MVVIASNLLRNNKYGMVFRVGSGAALSTMDSATDIYVIATYFQSDELVGQATALLAMICTTLFLEVIVVLVIDQRKSRTEKLKEAAISVFPLRPAVDAYRVSTNDNDDETAVDRLSELIVNKIIKLGSESIPGCVLQIYVWLINPEGARTFALPSILISALTTGYTSAMIAFDCDVDVTYRRNNPKFFGYVSLTRSEARSPFEHPQLSALTPLST